jgi:hypothetical protein
VLISGIGRVRKVEAGLGEVPTLHYALKRKFIIATISNLAPHLLGEMVMSK